MILITVGTWPLDRLVRAADELASRVDEDVIIQRGKGIYVPQHASHVDYVSQDRIEQWLYQTRVVISHAGAGSVLGVLQAGKPLVLVPRLARLGEVRDDHQFELAAALSERGQAVIVTKPTVQTLSEAIEQAITQGAQAFGQSRLHAALRVWLAEPVTVAPRWKWPLRRYD